MIAVGIDISKAKSTVAVIDSDGTVLASPFTMAHTQPEMEAFVTYLKGLGEPTTILMEYTGHYHYPVLKKLQDEGFPVCIVNPYQMKKYGDVEIHKAKTDKKDALRIAAYALEKSYKLVPYSSMEQKYEDLRVNPKFCVNAKLWCKIEQKYFKAGAAQAAAAFSTKITALRGDVKGGGVSLRSSQLLTFRLQPVSPACGRQRTPPTVRELRSSPAAFRSTSS